MIQHLTGAYALTFPREIVTAGVRNATWMVPLSVQEQLSELSFKWRQQIQWLEQLEESEFQNDMETGIAERLHMYEQWREAEQYRDEVASEYNPMNISHRTERYYGDEVDEHVHNEDIEDDEGREDEEDQVQEDEDEDVNIIARSLSARLHIAPKSEKDRVINLHERMAHAPEDAMCLAVQGSNPEWINTGVTAEEIHAVFKKEA